MQVEGDWKAAANLHLLLGNEHPPARLEKPLLTPQQRAAGGPAVVVVDARNTANFRSSSYCGLQEKSAPSIRKNVIAYYKDMLHRVPLWRTAVKKREAGTATTAAVKAEPTEEDAEDGLPQPAGADAASHTADSDRSGPLFRAVGILTQVHDPSAVSAATQQAPWEFYVIRDVEDDDCYVRALQAMTQQQTAANSAAALMLLQGGGSGSGPRTSQTSGLGSTRTSGALADATGAGGSAMAGMGAAGEETAISAAEADEEAASRDGTRLSLYTRQVPQFTGLYPGMAVGVVGEPFQRSARGVLTGVLVREFVLPARPTLPWRVDRPLPPARESSGSARLHFCSGPFPRRDVAGLLRTVTLQALHRGADVLIIGGPFILPFTNDFERGLLPSLGATFNEVMESFVDTLEETLKQYYATRPLLPHMKVLLVSHKGDVMQVPVLPTTMYAIADTEEILVRSNPCRLSVNGVHVTVCNEDVIGAMRDRMVERWPTAEGSLRRVVEAMVDGRLYTPLYGFPVTTVDLKHLPQLKMDYVPLRNELLEIESTTQSSSGSGAKSARGATERHEDSRRPGLAMSRSWEAVLDLATSGDASLKQEAKRVKAEPASESEAVELTKATTSITGTANKEHDWTGASGEEFFPHVMFLPSTRPQFAVVTHQHEDVDGADLDNTAGASGVLVVNQEVWSTRSSPKFQLRVAEVTIPDTELALRRGATAASGVACGVLHIYSA